MTFVYAAPLYSACEPWTEPNNQLRIYPHESSTVLIAPFRPKSELEVTLERLIDEYSIKPIIALRLLKSLDFNYEQALVFALAASRSSQNVKDVYETITGKKFG